MDKNKNVWLMPTDKPTQNIYITDNSEIKEGDWCYYIELKDDKVDRCYQVTKYHTWTNNGVDKTRKFKKIILTTDQDLIKDGVWGIEDGFLEWFVKNPTCEYVELKGYAIILPGESCDCDNMCDACKEEVVDGLTMGQIPANEETREYDLLQHIKFCLECKNESQAIRLIEKYGFVKQEQDKNKYSEEEVLNIILKYELAKRNKGIYWSDREVKEWFEQFKKK